MIAAVLTRNRRDLLRECLAALTCQTRTPDGIVVVDNASTDGTREVVAAEFPAVRLVPLPENVGATGGYYEGIKAAHADGADWIWILDDDGIATPTALEELLAALGRLDGMRPPALLGSRVEWHDGQPHRMNRPVLPRARSGLVVDAVERGLLPVRATTWISLLLSRGAVDRCGLPPRHFFYQSDDIEYTARILRDAPGYHVPGSVVEHRTPTQHTAVDDDHRFHYHVRNTILMLRGEAWRLGEKPNLIWGLVTTSAVYLRQNRFRRGSLKNLVSAVLAGVRFRLD